ncbi:condensin complex subunit 2 [Coccinella septempunctata]|uniref:condensin complex subunit 2 n=1 Tax=Coccinella septempunctata TaxID=41139 RepID=UPI001D06C092|nr:condensin complex subunit 2 [Coccinella septempunctata]
MMINIMMEASTPANNKGNSLRRRTLMKLVDTPITSEPINDETERSSRRSIIEIQKKAQVVAQSPSLNDSVRFSGEQEIKDHLQICTKLYAENKITTGVAWQLQIIDLLRVVSRKQSSDSLQVASTSLDIGAKVYGLRVDDVHAEGLKLANSMARFAAKNQAPEKENEDVENNVENPEDAPKAKKKKKTLRFDAGVKNTVVKDRNTLLAPIPQLESVFFSNRIDSNLSTVDNLFTNSLPMDKSCCKLLALGEVKAWVTGPDEAVEGLEEPKSFDIDLLPKDGNICTPFQNFILDQWNPDEEDQNNPSKNDVFDNDVVVYDDNGIPLHELDGSIHEEDFNDNNDVGLAEDDDEPPTENFLAQQIQHDVAHVVDIMKTETTLQRSEYSYNTVITLGNGKVIDQIWAGPSHWKLKFLRRSKARYSGAVEAQTVARQKKKLKTKEPEPIDLLNSEDVEAELEKLKRIKIKKKIYPSNKITLPLPDASCRNMMNDVYELMIKPGTIVTQGRNDRVEDTQDNFDNMGPMEAEEHDMDNDDGMDHMDHMDHDPGNDIEREQTEIFREEQNFMGDNLVDAPEYAAKIYIPYALQAKKMDMKKLKSFIWQTLTQNSAEKTKKVMPTTFSKVYGHSKVTLPSAMAKELSCSLAFSAILHLCNEETLKLTQVQGSKDFMIESG